MTSLIPPFALFLALVLAMSSAQKFTARRRASAATANLLGISLSNAAILSLAAAAIEAMAAIALLFSATRPLGAAIAAILWLAYALALLGARRRGIAFDCACSFGSEAKPVDAFALARAFGLAAGAVLVARVPHGAIGVEAVFAALGLMALYLAAGELAALPKLQRRTAG